MLWHGRPNGCGLRLPSPAHTSTLKELFKNSGKDRYGHKFGFKNLNMVF